MYDSPVAISRTSEQMKSLQKTKKPILIPLTF